MFHLLSFGEQTMGQFLNIPRGSLYVKFEVYYFWPVLYFSCSTCGPTDQLVPLCVNRNS